MHDIIFEDEHFDKVDFAIAPLQKGQYDNCRFAACHLANANLTDFLFVDCMFDGCDLSNAHLANTAFRDVRFVNCKMIGLRFELCNSFGLAVLFEMCNLSYSSFYGTKLKKTIFRHVVLHEADLTEADLTEAVLEHSDLRDAKFENTNLAKADLRTSKNYSIDPEINHIKKARFGLSGIAGLLEKYDIDIDMKH